MKINTSLYNFKKKHKSKKNQVLFHKTDCLNNKIIENIINNFLVKKIALFLNQQRKGELGGAIQFLELILTKSGNLIKKKFS